VQGSCLVEEQRRQVLVVAGPQLERLLVLCRRNREAVERKCAVACIAEGEPRPGLELHILTAGGTNELEGCAPVMREHLGVVLRASETRDPLGGPAMLVGPVTAGDLPVRDVPDERMGEGELGRAVHGGAALSADEALSLERVERRHRLLRRIRQPVRPEDLPDDRRVVEQVLLAAGKTVQARCDDALQGLREGKLVRGAALGVELRVLLGVKGVPARALEQRPLRLGLEHGRVEYPSEQHRGLLVVEG
jgi:hypothetical protein